MVQKFNVIILAAGCSHRMGSAKPLLPVAGKTLLQWQIEQLTRYVPDQIVVITNSDLFSTLTKLVSQKVMVVENMQTEFGPFASIYLGLQEIAGPTLILPVDTPLAPFPVLNPLLSGSADIVQIENQNGQGGHPILLTTNFVTYLKSLTLTTELRLDYLIKQSQFSKQRVFIDHEYPFWNLNTQTAYKHFLATI